MRQPRNRTFHRCFRRTGGLFVILDDDDALHELVRPGDAINDAEGKNPKCDGDFGLDAVEEFGFGGGLSTILHKIIRIERRLFASLIRR